LDEIKWLGENLAKVQGFVDVAAHIGQLSEGMGYQFAVDVSEKLHKN
jgi:hypothetical protein